SNTRACPPLAVLLVRWAFMLRSPLRGWSQTGSRGGIACRTDVLNGDDTGRRQRELREELGEDRRDGPVGRGHLDDGQAANEALRARTGVDEGLVAVALSRVGNL